MTSHIIDAHGHAWPITGDWCAICEWPLTPVRHGQDRHLQCAVDALDENTTMSNLEQTLHADVYRQCYGGEAPPGHRVWRWMPDLFKDDRLDFIYVNDDEDFLFRFYEDLCPVCHVMRRSTRHGDLGFFVLDAVPDPWVFCPGCSIAVFCIVCGHLSKSTDRRADGRFPDLCLEHAGQLSYTA